MTKLSFHTMDHTKLFNEYGTYRSNVQHLLTTSFNFPLDYQDTLSYYKRLYWSAAYFRSNLYRNYGKIQREGIEFIPIYLQSIGTVDDNEQLELSFRAAKPEFDLYPYVLIKKAQK